MPLERVEQLAEWIVRFAQKVALLEVRRSDVEAGIVRRRVKPTMRVKNAARSMAEVKPVRIMRRRGRRNELGVRVRRHWFSLRRLVLCGKKGWF
jgi:hypothetical protein